MNSNFFKLMFVSLVSCALSVPAHAAADTKKVPTTRIIVPDDAPPENLDDDSAEEPLAIPTDDLPPVTEPQKTDTDDAPSQKPAPVPTIQTDLSKLPDAVRQTRQNLLDAAASGDINNLRPFIGVGEQATNLSLGGIEGDPIDYLKSVSGDDAGIEILAILSEILGAGYVHTDAGTEDELYVWPYFFTYPLEKLTPQQRVELFKILTAGDVQDSEEFGSYIFFRAGIRPDGTWSFFLAGD